MVSTPGLGYNSWQQNIYADGMSHSNLYSIYNNGVGKVALRLKSTLPRQQVTTQLQAKEFNSGYMTPVLQHLGQSGTIRLPIAFNYVYPDMIPTYSALTNWQGMQLPGGSTPQPLPVQGYTDPNTMYQQPQYSGFPQNYGQAQGGYSNPYAAYGAQPNYGIQAPQMSAPYGYSPNYFG